MSRLDNFEEILKSYEGREPASDSSFGIEACDDFYRIHGVHYRDEIISCDLVKNLLIRGIMSGNLERHAKHALNAKDDEFRAASAPLAYAVFKALYQNRDCQDKTILLGAETVPAAVHVDAAVAMLRKFFSDQSQVILLSRAVYRPGGFDEVMHDYKQPTQYSKKARLSGPDCIMRASAPEFVQALLDTKDSAETVSDVLKFIIGVDEDARVARPNMILDKEYAYAVSLSNLRKIASLHSNISTDYMSSALGVRLVRKVEK